MNLRNYFRQNNSVHFPYLLQGSGLSKQELVLRITQLWDDWHVVNNMIYTKPNRKQWYFELCPSKYKRGGYRPEESMQSMWLSNRGEDRHISAFSHDKAWKQNVDEGGSVSCRDTLVKAPLFWIEIDRKDWRGDTDLDKAIDDGLTILRNLKGEVLRRNENIPTESVGWLFSSGNKSVHLAINGSLFGSPITDQKWCGRRKVWYNLAHKIAGDVRFGNGTDDISTLSESKLENTFQDAYPNVTILNEPHARKILNAPKLPKDKLRLALKEHPNLFLWDGQIASQALENIDPNIYHVNALIRQPWSRHETGGYHKVLIDETGYRTKPQPIEIKQLPPVLLDWWWDSWDEPEYKKEFGTNYNTGYIIEQYKEVFPYIEHMEPNSSNFVGPVLNPFYSDTNASCYISLDNGALKDFGSSRYSMSFEEFLIKKKEL